MHRKAIASGCLLAFAAAVTLHASALAGAAGPDVLAPAPGATTAAPPAAKRALLKPGQPIPAGELAAFVDGVMAAEMRARHIAGGAVSVVQHGRVVLERGYGVSHVTPDRPVDPERTLFRIGSVSKVFTWIALAQAAEQGKVRLDAPVNDYLPRDLRIPAQGFSQPVTLDHLMSHAGGFEDIALGHLLVLDPKKLTSIETYARDHPPRRVRAPGHPSYSNYGALLAGIIASEKAGTDYPTMIDRQVLAPLGMTRTTFREPYPARAGLPAPMAPDLARDMSGGFRWAAGRYEPLGVEYITHGAPAGAASSTAADMARVMLLLLGDGEVDGARIYGPQTARLFRTNLVEVPAGMNGWAHGLMSDWTAGYPAFGHDGDTNAFHTSLVTIPDLGLGIFATTNTEGGQTLATALPALVVEHFYGRRPIPAPVKAMTRAELEAYAGTYLATRRGFSGLEKFIGLMQGASIAVAKDGLLIETGGPAKLYRPSAEAGVFRTGDGDGVASFDVVDGRVIRWRTLGGSQQWEPARPWERPTPLLVLAGLALVAAVATLVGMFTRRRPYPQTGAQKVASRIQTATAAAWMVAAGAMAMWLPVAGDTVKLVVEWPQPFILVFSWMALLASLLSVVGVGILVPVWRAPRDGGWSVWRKGRFTMTVLIFAATAACLALRGGLEPWTA
jgi:CubicO group peptidase (beta-lactamase class C family)